MWYIPTAVGIMIRGHGYKCGIYEHSVVINIHIYTKIFCGGGGWCEKSSRKEDVIKVIEWSLVQIFSFCFNYGLLVT